MCTATVIADGVGHRLVHSRDELRSRAPGLPPETRETSQPGVRMTLPIDPDAGGSWLCATDAGLSLCVLNLNIPDNGRPSPTRSRGLLVPAIAHAEPGLDPRDLVRALRARFDDLRPFAPFRLLAVRGLAAHLARWDGLELTQDTLSGGEGFSPICLVSSGLGDDRVAPRLPLFDEMVRPDPTPATQDAYHRHRWPDRPEISVRMSRPDARTVAITTVEGDPPRVRYEPLADAG